MGRRDKRRSKERRLKKRMDKASTGRIGELLRRDRDIVQILDLAKKQEIKVDPEYAAKLRAKELIAFDTETQPITANLRAGTAVHDLLQSYFTKGEQP